MKQKLIFVLVWACLNSLEFMNLLYIQCETILSTTLFRLMKKVQMQECRGGGDAMAPPDFGRSVNPIST